jgi:peroxiredoxin
MQTLISRFAFFFVSVALIAACGATQKGATLSGTINGAANMQILLEQFHFDGKNKAIGKAQADASGAFSINDPVGFEKGMYRIGVGAKQVFFLLDGTEKGIKFSGDINTFQQMDVKFEGSEAADCYVRKVKELSALQGQPFTPEMAKEKIANACNPLMGALMTSQFFGQSAAGFLPEFKLAAEKLANYMPNSKYATDYAAQIKQLEASTKPQSATELAVGQPAPEISLTDPSGTIRSLSGLKGKIVLLDFWASWCGPCRRENPNVVRVYNKYKEKGFTVFSVSLDRENGKNAWVQAIQQDGLIWDDHVSDLKGWQSDAAALYGVRGIPQTYLLDREGKIAAINPRADLEGAVKKALGL